MVMRIGGLASGMDIDSVVKQMMTSYKAPVNKMSQKLQQLEWKREGLRELNRSVLEFRNNTLFNFMLGSNFKQKKAEVTGNTSAITATVRGDAIEGTISVDILNRATAANAQTRSLGTNLSFDSKLSSLTLPENAPPLPEDIEFTINGESVKVKSDWTIGQFISEINAKTSVSAYFDANSGKIAFQSKTTGSSNGDSNSDKIVFTGAVFGADGLFEIESENAANDARVNINGMVVTQASNTFQINGVSFTVNENSGMATIEVKTDTDKVVDMVKGFIESYNSLLSNIQSKLNEQRYRDFLPLTDEQRKQFKEEGHDLEEWTEKAKSGLLRNDSTLNRLLMDMRMSIASELETTLGITSLNDIGITQERYVKGSEKNGNLVISDEAKLRKAIEQDPDALINLFTQRGNGDNDLSDVGIGERLYRNLKTALDDITRQAGNPNAQDEVDSVLSKQIIDLGLNIDRQNQRLFKIESNLYKRFTAMETAISRYASQAAYLANAFGGGNGNG